MGPEGSDVGAPTLGLATCAALPGLSPDDRCLLAALLARGLAVEPLVWEDRHVAWAELDLVVVRSVWDYAYRRQDFVAWAEQVGAQTGLANPVAMLRWNSHKGYLLELEARGVAVVPTELVAAGAGADLGARLHPRGWTEVVLKPAVGAAGRWVQRFHASEADAIARRCERLLASEDVLLQPYLSSVRTWGERSLVWIDGALTHAVHKRAAGEDFRVHDDYGGAVERVEPAADEVELAARALAAVDGTPLYGRVDLIRDDQDRPLLTELELVEPELFFRFSDEAVARMCDAIGARLHAR